ncbi:MAG: type I DNA topoisomerase, partial [Actinomycetota bacterium]|nr:type I DNA topoisomerase [Actinomycetota bacterium]
KKVMPRLSAGRVQSVATRVVVERERARMRFRNADYWDIEGTFSAEGQDERLVATLVTVDGQRLATGRDFDPDTGQTTREVLQLDEATARDLALRLESVPFRVRVVEEKPYTRKPHAPFMTSTLQQEAGRKLRMSSRQVMQTAQRLYENGYITYMRTDSTNLSETAISAARSQARSLYGEEYVPESPRVYAKKVKNAQEAHEAIRPSGDVFRTPGEVRNELRGEEYRLYEIIWQRTVASQMADARGTTATVRLGAQTADGTDVELSASGRTITFKGFLAAYVEEAEEEGGDREDTEKRLPRVTVGQALTTHDLEPQGHTTSPPARYTEASLVKQLEELGIGRPSTYASIISTIQDRGYVWKKGSALVPTWLAFAVIGLLEQHFGRLVDYGFTASMEDDLDQIADGARDSVDWLTRFYFGSEEGSEGGLAKQGGLKKLVSDRLGDIDARAVNSLQIGTTEDGTPVVVRVGRYGPYVEIGEKKASLPEDLAPDELTVERAVELADAPSGDRVLGTHPDSGLEVAVRNGRFGPYVSLLLPEGSTGKPPAASVFKTMDPATIELDDALKLLSLPRVLGEVDGEPVTAQNGRYGPYITRGKESRSLASEDDLFTVTLDDAKALLAQPKLRGRAAAAPPLKELGADPVSGQPMVVKEGRFGPYVTDGETNASLRKDDSIEELSDERAAELLADRRARGPVTRKKAAPRKAAKKATAKKAPAKKSPAKKTAKKP